MRSTPRIFAFQPEGNGRIALRDAQSRVIVLAARELARDEIDAVRVNAGRYVNGCSGKKLACALSENSAAFRIGARKLLGKFEQHRYGYPFVRVVRGVIEDALFTLAECEIPQRLSHDRPAEPAGFDKRIACRDAAHAKRNER